MNVSAGVPVASSDAPVAPSPPGDPPDGFDHVLGAELQRFGEDGRHDDTRTARAEGVEQDEVAGRPRTDVADRADTAVTPDSGEPRQLDRHAAAAAAASVAAEVSSAAGATATPAAVPAVDSNLDSIDPVTGGVVRSTAPLVGGAAQSAAAPSLNGVLPSGDPAAVEPGAMSFVPGEAASVEAQLAAKAVQSPTPTPVAPLPDQNGELEKTQRAATRPSVDPAAQVASNGEPEVAGPQGRQPRPGHEQTGDGRRLDPAMHERRPEQAAVGVAATAVAGSPEEQSKARPGLATGGTASEVQTGANARPADTPAPIQPLTTAGARQGGEVVGEAAATDAPVKARARLGELADIAGTVIRVAARDGKATARITLRPAELGEVEIRLRYHAGGVSAEVVTESRQAAQLLTQATGELRRSLESQGLIVHWLDVREGQDGRRPWDELDTSGRRGARGAEGVLEMEETTTIEASSLPGVAGAVDVLA